MEGQLFAVLCEVVAALGKGQPFAGTGKWYSDAWVALVYLWAVLHDRPTGWACDARNWPAGERRWRVLPPRSTMSVRLRTVGVLALLARAQAALRDRLGRGASKWLDSKPLVVGGASKDRDARAGRAVRGTARGYRLHAVVDAASGMVDAWRLAAMADNDKLVARRLLPEAVAACATAGVPVLYVAADDGYGANDLYELPASAAARAPPPVVAARREAAKAPGHRKQSPRRLRSVALACAYDRPHNPLNRPGVPPSSGEQLLADRGGIGRRFGTTGNLGGGLGRPGAAWGGLGPLPDWVRTPHRVAARVQGKPLIVDGPRAAETARQRQGVTRGIKNAGQPWAMLCRRCRG
jgi:hypothetical protein